MTDCIFCKIANHEMSTDLVYESEGVVVFNDINPRAPVHLLVVPKRHLEEFYKITAKDKEVWEEMLTTIRKMIKKFKLDNQGYRLVTNGGGAQAIDHFHIHVMGGINNTREL